jgi:hypothetical protein
LRFYKLNNSLGSSENIMGIFVIPGPRCAKASAGEPEPLRAQASKLAEGKGIQGRAVKTIVVIRIFFKKIIMFYCLFHQKYILMHSYFSLLDSLSSLSLAGNDKGFTHNQLLK